MTAKPWTPNEIDEAEKCAARGDFINDYAVRRALATIRALQAEIAELKTPSGYCDEEGGVVWRPESAGGDPARTLGDL